MNSWPVLSVICEMGLYLAHTDTEPVLCMEIELHGNRCLEQENIMGQQKRALLLLNILSNYLLCATCKDETPQVRLLRPVIKRWKVFWDIISVCDKMKCDTQRLNFKTLFIYIIWYVNIFNNFAANYNCPIIEVIWTMVQLYTLFLHLINHFNVYVAKVQEAKVFVIWTFLKIFPMIDQYIFRQYYSCKTYI